MCFPANTAAKTQTTDSSTNAIYAATEKSGKWLSKSPTNTSIHSWTLADRYIYNWLVFVLFFTGLLWRKVLRWDGRFYLRQSSDIRDSKQNRCWNISNRFTTICARPTKKPASMSAGNRYVYVFQQNISVNELIVIHKGPVNGEFTVKLYEFNLSS